MERPTPDEIKAMVEKEIEINPKKHCYRERMKRQSARLFAIKQLMKKYGYTK